LDISRSIEHIRAGDRTAFAGIIRHYQAPLFGFLGRMGLTQAHAEDLAQETFLRAWRQIDRFDPRRAEFSTWLFTLARNLTLNELSRAANRREVTMGDELPEVADPQPQPLEAVLAEERKRHLRAALQQLPLADRSVLALAYVEALDMAAIARIEGCAVGAIKTRLHRARQRLRKHLEGNDE